MKGPLPPHLAYLASAGSGKTYRLAHRVIHLLALGVEPGSICALTFSRKAAGEIFESVVKYLVEASELEKNAAATARVLGLAGAGRDEFRDCLRAFLDGMHRSSIGTIDSFIHGVAQAFACELGVASTFEVMDSGGLDAQLQRAGVLDRILRPASATNEQMEVFLEAFRQATYGKTEKNFLRKLNTIVGAYQPVYQLAPEPGRWSVSAVWPSGFPFAPPSDGEAAAAAARIRQWAEADGGAKLLGDIQTLLETVENFAAGKNWPKSTPFANACKVFADLCRGRAEFNVSGKKRAFEGELAAAWAALIRRVAGLELERRFRMTAGIFQILERFERDYQAEMRLTGRMTFDDLTRLLAARPEGGGLTCDPARPGRIFIDYRLDARIRHWLLDEFQDTSDLQWAVLGNLVDEVMQDAGDERRFFCVGDVKQAIYGWRGGNARLFDRLLERYAGALHVEPLPESFRSCPAVIEAVNRLFGDISFGSVIPQRVEERWVTLWEEHTVAERNRALSGCTAVIDCPLAGRNYKDNVLAAVLPPMRELLRTINPPARGLDCAILVRSNTEAMAVVEDLRAHLPDLPVLLEGQSGLMDCPAILVLLSALRAAFHPADRVAGGVVRMSPLGGLTGAAAVSAATTRRDFSTGGASGAMTRLWQALASAAPPDAFTNFRVAVLLDLASDFDAGGGGTADDFDALVREHEFDDRSASGAVRVMTIHKSKGLGFDLVMLPGLSASGFGPKSRGETLLQAGDSAHPDWVLHKPNKDVCELDPVLSAAQQQVAEDEIFEEVCLFYVALTRAKRGLYLFTASGEKPDLTKQGGYVLEKLGRAETGIALPGAGRVVQMLGDWEWFGGSPVRVRAAAPVGAELAIPADFIAAAEEELEGVSPSATRDFEQAGDRVFDPDSSRVLDFGTHMHALFEKVEWLEEADPEALLAEWRREARPDEAMDRHITPQFLACFGHADFRRELARPQVASTLWREKRFEIVVGGKWVSGTFDRVVLTHGGGGEVESAMILDYKTNRVADAAAVARAAAHYSGQMGAYRQALAMMLGIDPGRIRAALLFTVPGVAAGLSS